MLVACEVGFLLVFWTWVACALLFLRNTILPRLPLLQSLESFGLPAETVHFDATDGLTLEGWKILADPTRPWIILCHGLGSNRADLLEIAVGLSAARFNLFLFDFRGHGGSAGRTTSFGHQEQRDLEGALSYLGAQLDLSTRSYGIYGISMGGAVAMMVAARDDRLRAIVADSPYLNLQETLEHHLKLMYRLPRYPFAWFMLVTYKLRFGVWPTQISPQRACERFRHHQTLLLIQGASDVRVRPEGTRSIVEAARTPAALWMVEGAGHLEAYSQDPTRYLDRLIAFFEANLS